MSEEHYENTKESVLAHIQNLFDEMEEEMAMSHQEKYALLEDAFENASDTDELKVAFEQWHADHSEDIGLSQNADELWGQALEGEAVYDNYEKDEEEEVESAPNIFEEVESEADDFKNSDEY